MLQASLVWADAGVLASVKTSATHGWYMQVLCAGDGHCHYVVHSWDAWNHANHSRAGPGRGIPIDSARTQGCGRWLLQRHVNCTLLSGVHFILEASEISGNVGALARLTANQWLCHTQTRPLYGDTRQTLQDPQEHVSFIEPTLPTSGLAPNTHT